MTASSQLLTGPAFEPWERFLILSHALEEVPAGRAGELLPLVSTTAMTVVRQIMGQKTKAEAYAAIERTRQAIEDARRSKSCRRG